MKRLIKKNRVKTAALKYTYDLDSFVLESGDVIAFACRVVNNKPWFQVYQEGLYNTSSYYDGDDYERASRMYSDLMSAFMGITAVENLTKKINVQIKSDIDK